MVNFDYAWNLGQANPRLSVRPERGSVPKGGRVVCELTYTPHAPDSLAGHRITCQVSGCKHRLVYDGRMLKLMSIQVYRLLQRSRGD